MVRRDIAFFHIVGMEWNDTAWHCIYQIYNIAWICMILHCTQCIVLHCLANLLIVLDGVALYLKVLHGIALYRMDSIILHWILHWFIYCRNLMFGILSCISQDNCPLNCKFWFVLYICSMISFGGFLAECLPCYCFV